MTVYEKAMAGCIEYMNAYVYFDQDGYVLEISQTKLDDAPCITGMSFESMELHEKLPIKDEDRFKIILKLWNIFNWMNFIFEHQKYCIINVPFCKYKILYLFLIIMLAKAVQDSSVTETVFENRFAIVKELEKLNARIQVKEQKALIKGNIKLLRCCQSENR